MYEYAAYGARLTSALAFPELPPPDDASAAVARWQLDVRAAPPPSLAGASELGAATYAGGAVLSLARAGDTWRLTTSDAGSWDVEAGEGRMCWWRAAGHREAIARYDALGRVMPLLLHARGALCLHGSGVATDAGAVVFLGPKGRGKSSLALACVAAGARLAGDDVAVLTSSPEPSLHPGVPVARLWADAARTLGQLPRGEAAPGGDKLVVPPPPIERRLTVAAPLRAVYLLEPADAAAPAVSREPLTGATATLAILAQATSARLLGGAEQAMLLTRAAALAGLVPIHVLRVARDLSRLGQAAETVVAWIGEDAARRDADRPVLAWA